MGQRPGRPLGDFAQSVLNLARTAPREYVGLQSGKPVRGVTVIDVQTVLQLNREDASDTLYELRRCGHLKAIDRTRAEGLIKPLPVCAPADAVVAEPSPSLLVLDWFRR